MPLQRAAAEKGLADSSSNMLAGVEKRRPSQAAQKSSAHERPYTYSYLLPMLDGQPI
jgi:hypothetical protein